MISIVLVPVGFAVCVFGLGCLVLGRLAPWRVSGLMAIANGLYLISNVMGGIV